MQSGLERGFRYFKVSPIKAFRYISHVSVDKVLQLAGLMKIKYSRHAKRRAKLYGIPETIISDLLTDLNLHQGEHEIIKNVSGFKYPLKIVVSIENNLTPVKTNYSLKKGGKITIMRLMLYILR